MNIEEKVALENKYRDRLMKLFLEMAADSGYELCAVEMGIEEIEEVEGGFNVVSGMNFYWDDDIEDIDMDDFLENQRNKPKS